MSVRRPNTRVAAVEVAFVFLSGVAGAMAEPWWWAGLFALGNVAHWGWSRREDILRIAPERRPAQIGLGLGLIAGVNAIVYGLGSLIGGVI